VLHRSPVAARLQAIYGSVDNVDAFVGILAEPHVAGTEFGELQLAIWTKQFQALRDGDRFFYGNDQGLTTIRNLYASTSGTRWARSSRRTPMRPTRRA
jgi:peroxidase